MDTDLVFLYAEQDITELEEISKLTFSNLQEKSLLIKLSNTTSLSMEESVFMNSSSESPKKHDCTYPFNIFKYLLLAIF
jgi:hypothetical protein